MDDETRRGVIKGVQGNGGILTLLLEDPVTHRRTSVHADNGVTVRAFMAVLGPEIVRGHTLLVDMLIGREIGYGVDGVGLLSYITE